MTTTPEFQPFVHHVVTTLHGPSVTLSRRDGQIDGTGAQGFYLGDRRMIASLTVRLFGREPDVVRSDHHHDGTLVVHAVARNGLEPTPDPTLLMVRTRRQHPRGFTDEVAVHNLGPAPRQVQAGIDATADFAPSTSVKRGVSVALVEPDVAGDPIAFRRGAAHVRITATGPGEVSRRGPSLRWDVHVPPHHHVTLLVDVSGDNPDAPFTEPGNAPTRSPTLRSSDPLLEAMFDWGVGDVRRLALSDPLAPADRFAAAGSPWYLTLFGRDSLWTARLAIPFDLDLAAGTLRSLARRQGRAVDVDSAEQPGRILHEQRAAAVDLGEMVLPPRYFGSIDATPLWIITLVEAWRWGLADSEVTALGPALEAAVGWLVDHADANGDGLVEYVDASGHGLANQGWKDSGDSVSWRDGRLARSPIALCEVQGYAYEAALGAADLLEHLDLPGSARCRRWAQRLRRAFQERFWLEDDGGPYVAIALDGDGLAVDSVSSNPGHLLGTGLLDAGQERAVARRLIDELACPAGLRTLAESSARFNPMSYHNGSIWPHDTAICARAMVLAGLPDEAAAVLRGVIASVEFFGGRLPELYCFTDASGVIPYPASCRPQAWSAATSLVAAWACTPVVPSPDGPRLLRPAPLAGEVDIDGITLGGVRLRTRLRAGRATITTQD